MDRLTRHELITYRKFLAGAGLVYLVWWGAVELMLPQAENPFLSRLCVVLVIFAVWLLSFKSRLVQAHLKNLFKASTWLITLHYFYLFYLNKGDINWVVGSFITVMAITLCFFSIRSLLYYSVFVLCTAGFMVFLFPDLRTSVFLPGLFTMILQANLGLTSRLKLIKTLQESNELFQMLFDSTFDGVVVHEKGRIVRANQSFADMMEYKKSEVLEKEVLDFIVTDQKNAVTQKLRIEQPIQYETTAVTKTGKIINVEVRSKILKMQDGFAKLAAVQDISDRKKAEKERVNTMAMAENLRLRDEFISIASHELKTPISSLNLQTQMIERSLKKTGAEALDRDSLREYMVLYHRQINRLTSLVDSMLDVSRISAGRLTLNIKKTDLSALTRDVLKFIEIHNTQNASVFVEAPETLFVNIDPERMAQVIENLLTNAFKYGEGKPIGLKLTQTSEGVFISVEDQGIGIAPGYLDKIFNRFERAISARNISGFGLGLFIAKQIVETHGGHISVVSAPGKGSTFTVKLPLI